MRIHLDYRCYCIYNLIKGIDVPCKKFYKEEKSQNEKETETIIPNALFGNHDDYHVANQCIRSIHYHSRQGPPYQGIFQCLQQNHNQLEENVQCYQLSHLLQKVWYIQMDKAGNGKIHTDQLHTYFFQEVSHHRRSELHVYSKSIQQQE